MEPDFHSMEENFHSISSLREKSRRNSAQRRGAAGAQRKRRQGMSRIGTRLASSFASLPLWVFALEESAEFSAEAWSRRGAEEAKTGGLCRLIQGVLIYSGLQTNGTKIRRFSVEGVLFCGPESALPETAGKRCGSRFAGFSPHSLSFLTPDTGSPDDSGAIGCEATVAGADGHVLDERLTNHQPIKRVSMMERERGQRR